jgi:hypothetical protein
MCGKLLRKKMEDPKHTQTKMTAISRNLGSTKFEYSIPEILQCIGCTNRMGQFSDCCFDEPG